MTRLFPENLVSISLWRGCYHSANFVGWKKLLHIVVFREKISWFFRHRRYAIIFQLATFLEILSFSQFYVCLCPCLCICLRLCLFLCLCLFLSSPITKAHKDKVASDARSVGQQWLIGFLLFPICRWSVVRMLTNQLVGKETDKGCTQSHNPSDLPTRLGRSCFKTGSYWRRPSVGRERISVGWFLKFMTTL